MRGSVTTFRSVINAKDHTEFASLVFNHVSRFIKGSFEMRNDVPVPTFVNGSQVTIQQFGDSHIQIHHNKRSCLLSEMTMLMLVNLTKLNDEFSVNGKAPTPLEVIVYEYGHENSSKKIYDEIESRVAAGSGIDRSGASSFDTKRALIQKLKEYHSSRWNSPHEANWMAWAAYILQHRSSEQDEKVKEGPPPHLIHLFRDAEVSSGNIACYKSQNMLILGILDSLSEEEEKNFAHLKSLHEKRVSYISGMKALVLATINDIKVTENKVSLSYAHQIEKRVLDEIELD